MRLIDADALRENWFETSLGTKAVKLADVDVAPTINCTAQRNILEDLRDRVVSLQERFKFEHDYTALYVLKLVLEMIDEYNDNGAVV